MSLMSDYPISHRIEGNAVEMVEELAEVCGRTPEEQALAMLQSRMASDLQTNSFYPERKVFDGWLPMTSEDSSLVFRALNGDREAEKSVSIQTTEQFIPTETFGRFLEINRIRIVEEVLR